MATKRDDYISWDEYFMGVALLSAKRSKDPSTQVGACIVDAGNHVVALGYNGFPIGCSDDNFPWDRAADDSFDTKYPYVVHAELNAVLNKNSNSLDNCRIYVALFPCNECAKVIIQSGIKEVIYISDKYKETSSVKSSKRMFDASGVVYRQFETDKSSVTIDFSEDSI